jgi:HPt (histidine-containing phosphotransfer) domain-containing protein
VADKHLDLDILAALQEVMEEEYSTLLDTFLADCEERLDHLQKSGDIVQLIETAHSLKGSSGNMGAIHLAALCSTLESSAQDMPSVDLKALVAEIHDEFAFVRPLYEAELQRSLSEI